MTDRFKLSYKLTKREAGLLKLAARFGGHRFVSTYVHQAIQAYLQYHRKPGIIRPFALEELPPSRFLSGELAAALEALPDDSIDHRLDLWITPQDDVALMQAFADHDFKRELSPFIRHVIVSRLQQDGWPV